AAGTRGADNGLQRGAAGRLRCRYGPQHLPVGRAESDDPGGARSCAPEHEAETGARSVRDAEAAGLMENITDELDRLLDHVSHKLSIQDFNRELSRFWKHELRQRKHLHEIRFGRGRCKKLMDEIQPVAEFLRWKCI